MKTLQPVRSLNWLCKCFPLLWLLSFASATPASRPFTISMPFAGADSPTNYAREPFALEELGIASSRYQQVYGASEFAGLADHGAFISWIAFQSDGTFGRGFGADLPSIEILMGTTMRNPDSLSTTFADNPDGGLTTVYSRGFLSFDAGARGDLASITLQTPFLYNPADGNLLLEIRDYLRIPPPHQTLFVPGVLDAWKVSGDSVSRVYAYDVNAATGVADTLGLTTYFLVTPLPKLAISLQSSNLVIAWPRGPVEFTLEQSPVVGAGASWQPAGGIVTTNRTTDGTDDIEVRLPLGRNSSRRFFRVVWQTSSRRMASAQPNNEQKIYSHPHDTQYVFRSVIARDNLINLVPGSTNSLAQGIQLGNVERAVIENNFIDLLSQPPLSVSASKPLHFFNNQSSSGSLIQPLSGMDSDDLRHRIEDALTLAL